MDNQALTRLLARAIVGQARRRAQQGDRPGAINTGAISTPENPPTGENRDATSLSGCK